MDWRLAASTFLAVFLAELGDKTQIATFALSAGGRSRWAVFVGAALALVATSAVAVLAGGLIGRTIPVAWVKRLAVAVFLVIGFVLLFGPAETPA